MLKPNMEKQHLSNAAKNNNKDIVFYLSMLGASLEGLEQYPEHMELAQEAKIHVPNIIAEGNIPALVQLLQQMPVPLTFKNTFKDEQANTLLHKAVTHCVQARNLHDEKEREEKKARYKRMAKLLLGHTPELLCTTNSEEKTPVDLAVPDPALLQVLVQAAYTPKL
jgi:hypothetical protein